jgi:RNA polymerase sigma-70 factor (ECF subfamily)
MKERLCHLCQALNALPEAQGRRIEAHYLLGMSMRAIARAEGVHVDTIYDCIHRGLRAMKASFGISRCCPDKRHLSDPLL